MKATGINLRTVEKIAGSNRTTMFMPVSRAVHLEWDGRHKLEVGCRAKELREFLQQIRVIAIDNFKHSSRWAPVGLASKQGD